MSDFLKQYAPETVEEDEEDSEVADSINGSSDSGTLFQEGKMLQQKRTIAKQQAAIKKFQAAKLMYTTEQEKSKCDIEIAVCMEKIAELRKAQSDARQAEVSQAEDPDTKTPEHPVAPAQETTLSLSVNLLSFKAKPKDAMSITVTSSLENWSVSTSSSWIHFSKMGNQIFIAVDKNDTGDNRTGTVVVKAGTKSATVTVSQSKKKSILGL